MSCGSIRRDPPPLPAPVSRVVDPKEQHAARLFPRAVDPVHLLTERQRLILDLMTRPGRRPSTGLVAAELGLAEQTVKNHLSDAYRTLGVHTLGQAMRAILDRRAA